MSEIAPEFSRRFRLDAIGGEARPIEIDAKAEERTLLARRFGLITLDLLTARASLIATAQGIEAKGSMTARGSQACVVTGDPLSFRIDEAFAIRFVADDAPEGDEIELDVADCDIIAHDGNAIDLGEAAAQTLGLALDPFPRGPRAEMELKKAGVLSEGEAGPFGALAALKEKMKRG